MVTLEDIFQHTVATGWRPRSVAVGAELARLEASLVRGTCIAPLAVDGDTLFIDPHAAPQPGDLVAFALSRRGCEAQNSSPPAEGPAQPTWRRGDRWVKLLAEYRGFLMLLDRHGSAACATLLACESPNDVPVLHTVRNVMRGGRLLYAPATFASALRPNAATELASVSQSFSGGGTAFGTGTTQVGTGVSFTLPDAGVAGVELTVSADIAADGGPDSGVYFTAFVSGHLSAGSTQALWQGNGGTRGMATGTAQVTGLAAGTYTAALFCINTPGASNIKCWGYTLSVDLIKR